jgi:hypothetical protein
MSNTLGKTAAFRLQVDRHRTTDRLLGTIPNCLSELHRWPFSRRPGRFAFALGPLSSKPLDCPTNSRYYKRLSAGFERIFYSTFSFCSDQELGEAVVTERQSFRSLKDAKLWYAEPGTLHSPTVSQRKKGPERHCSLASVVT